MKARYSAPVRTGPKAHPTSYTMGTGPFPGVRWPGRGVDHPPTSINEVKKILLLLLLLLVKIISPLCRVFTQIFLRQTISLRNTMYIIIIITTIIIITNIIIVKLKLG
jgi:hypothetical protein